MPIPSIRRRTLKELVKSAWLYARYSTRYDWHTSIESLSVSSQGMQISDDTLLGVDLVSQKQIVMRCGRPVAHPRGKPRFTKWISFLISRFARIWFSFCAEYSLRDLFSRPPCDFDRMEQKWFYFRSWGRGAPVAEIVDSISSSRSLSLSFSI